VERRADARHRVNMKHPGTSAKGGLTRISAARPRFAGTDLLDTASAKALVGAATRVETRFPEPTLP
jgi:hypothetical protein